MGSRQYSNTPTSGFRDHWARYAAMPPPYSKYSNPAATASERQPLLSISVVPVVRRPQGSARKPMTWSVVVGIAILHFIAIFYAVWVLAYYWRSSHGPLSPAPLPTYNIAIVGAGPAGIAAAQHLYNSLFAREVNFNITIYESKPVVGGVLAIHHANGSSVFPKDDPMQSPITAEDITGKALLWDNTLFTRDSEKALRDKVDFFERGPEQIGYYRNGAKTVSATRPYSKTPLWTWLHLLWSYGNSVGLGNELAQDGTLREAMTKVPLVPDIEKIFQSLGVLNAAKQPARHMLGGRGISERYAAEIVEPQVQRAYHQSLSTVSGLTAMMAAAREESANSYEGGDVIDRLQKIVSETNVNVRTSTRVTGMKYMEMDEERPAWLIRYESAEGNGGARKRRSTYLRSGDSLQY
ncbi:hypothetical protein NUW58_g3064 [Xylaria curta]|uniref:Uncharacterized protein n=1 Tax=Xylaria curta TaxID=42375 RepID=A0ACC1PFB1_9PEZI|nr:hypothetical protein NUW58_g3064 [Xylaria curta]